MQLVCAAPGPAGPGFLAHAVYGLRAQLARFGDLVWGRETPGQHGPRPALFRRRVVQKGVGAGRQDCLSQGRRGAQLAAMEAQLAPLMAAQEALQAGDVHQLMQAVFDGLLH